MEESSLTGNAPSTGIAADPAQDAAEHTRRGARDVREWIARVEAAGELKRIDARVDLDQELSAIACMAAQREDAPALLFSQFTEPAEGRVLINMLGASARRYALAVGLDPDLPVPRLITETRRIMRRRIAPERIAPAQATTST